MAKGDKIAKQLGDRYKVLSGSDVHRMIAKILKDNGEPLTNGQDIVLSREFGNGGMLGNLDLPFLAYSWDEVKVETKWYWRITAPLLWIYMVIFTFIMMPIKWVFTGKAYLPQTSKWLQVNMDWINKVYDRRW